MKIDLTEKQIKWIRTALVHQWQNMTDDNGNAINCKQENVDGTYECMCMFDELINKQNIETINKERMIDIIQNFYGDMVLAEPENEIRETIQDIKLTKEEAIELGIETAIMYME